MAEVTGPGRPLSIVHVTAFMTVGGVQNMLLGTLPLYDRERFNVRVCCLTRMGEVGEKLIERGVPVDVCRVPSRLGPFGIRRLARWLREARADIVHTHMYAPNITGVVAARLAGAPVIVSHVHSTHEWRSPTRAWLDGRLDRWRHGAIAVSEAVKREYVARTGLHNPDKVRVMHNAPRELPREPGAAGRLRAELGLPERARVIGSVTRLVPVKDLPTLLRATAELMRRREDVWLVLVGRGRERAALERLAGELGIAGRTVFAGERLDVAAFFELFDVFALSSLTEGCPNVVMEAMGFDLPIVATDVGGVPELVRTERTGLLVPARDWAALAAALGRVLEDRELARRLGRGGAEFVRGFTRPAYVARLSAYYEELAQGRVRAGGL